MKIKVTIIGFGTMGRAMAKALLGSDPSVEVFGVDKLNYNNNSIKENIKKSDFIILAVKPQDAKDAIGQTKANFPEKAIFISIMAGVSIKKLSQLSGCKKIVRMMPNLGLSVGEGIAVWKASGLSLPEIKKVENFLDKITENFQVKDEDTINKVTAISGSGPAYFFMLAYSLMEACDKLGLKLDESVKLVQKTFSASAVLSRNQDYQKLIKKIASKGGTTEAALKIFKKKNFQKIILEAIFSAYKKAQELNK